MCKNFYKFILSIDNALLTTFSTVNPYFLNNTLAGADAPNVSIVTDLPLKPRYLPQQMLEPASTTKRFFYSLW